ncbi:type III ribulose-bisphosphate carboxylase [archaeon]|nr:type III ribulose-bisphosphate carboxylase [archaeon]
MSFYAKGFIDLTYQPSKTDLVALFRVEPAFGVEMDEACGAVAAESSVGTWTKVSTSTKKIMDKRARVFEINGKYCKIAYPSELFEGGNMPQILSSVAGNIFGMNVVENLRLEDIHFPPKLDKTFPGPKYGIPGIRKILKVKKRPLVGTIVKPKIGLDWKEHAKIAYEAWIGGCDIVKDDENLTSQVFNPFEKRVIETLRMRDKAEKETGEKKVYMPNISAETIEMLDRGEFVKDHGGRYIMVDIITCGWSGLQTVREANLGIIHAHRAMHAAITRNKTHGVSMLTVAKCARMVGVDQLHIGTAVGKMDGGVQEVEAIDREIELSFIREKGASHLLAEEWGKMKPVFAVASGGVHPGMIPKIMKIMGNDVIIQLGGGIHGHPKGTRAGAKAARAAVESTVARFPLDQVKVPELHEALEHWKV